LKLLNLVGFARLSTPSILICARSYTAWFGCLVTTGTSVELCDRSFKFGVPVDMKPVIDLAESMWCPFSGVCWKLYPERRDNCRLCLRLLRLSLRLKLSSNPIITSSFSAGSCSYRKWLLDFKSKPLPRLLPCSTTFSSTRAATLRLILVDPLN
jgi:hypothetical protein